MKILEKKENGLLKVEYYDKISREKIILDDVNPKVVEEIKKSAVEEKKYKRFAKRHLVSLEDLQEFFEFIDEDPDPESELMTTAEIEERRQFRYRMYNAMRKFTQRERDYVRMRYYENKQQNEIAIEMGVSEARVSQIGRKIDERLKNL